MDRREFLVRSGGLILGATVISLTGCEFNSVDPITTGKSVSFLTPVDEFYYKNGAETSIRDWSLPIVDRSAWQLRIDGLVSNPLNISIADIEAESANAINLLKTMRCVIDSNDVQGLIGTAVWRGVPLRIFLERAGIDTINTKRLFLYGEDTFTNNISLNELLNPGEGLIEPLLVTHMNGQPLTAEHGAPVRLIIHNSFGYKNVKWINRVEATADDTTLFGTYQEAGFVDDGVQRVVSRATDPLQNGQVPAGTVEVQGFAVSGAAGISSVMVSVNGRGFTEAIIQAQEDVLASDPLLPETIQFAGEGFSYPFTGVWVKWSHKFEATPGAYKVDIKAVDAAGNEQPRTDNEISDSINAISSITFSVV